MILFEEIIHVVQITHVLAHEEGQVAIVVLLVEHHRIGDLGRNPVNILDGAKLIGFANEESSWNFSIRVLERQFWR